MTTHKPLLEQIEDSLEDLREGRVVEFKKGVLTKK